MNKLFYFKIGTDKKYLDCAFSAKNTELTSALLRYNPYLIYYLEEQTPEICLAAVKQNGHVLEYVNEQTEEICLAAVKQSAYALQFVEEQTEEICFEAIRTSLTNNYTFSVPHMIVDDNMRKDILNRFILKEVTCSDE